MADLPDTVAVMECPNGSKVFIVGTAHFSLQSVEDVKKTINLVKPHSVVLELCRERRRILEVSEEIIQQQSNRMDWNTLRQLMDREGTIPGITQALFIKMSANMMDKLGIVPAGEFRAGFQEGQRNRCTIYLGDRNIRITFKRALNSLPLWQQLKFIKLLGYTLLFEMDISVEDVENMKNVDMLLMFTGQLAAELPALSKVLVDERDVYLAHSLMVAANCATEPHGEPQRVVGVVGIGHISGIKSHWMSEECKNVTELLKIPRPHKSTLVFWGYTSWGVQALVTFGGIWLARFTMGKFISFLNKIKFSIL